MPTETRSLADQRILRFAFGTGFSLCISQMLAWDQSYLAAVFTASFLALPMGPPRLLGGIKFIAILTLTLLLGFLILPVLKHYQAAGLIALAMAFFGVFYYGQRGGSPLVIGLATAGLAVIPLIGIYSVPAAVTIFQSLLKAGVVALLSLWLFHALFPDPPQQSVIPAAAPQSLENPDAGRLAARSTLVVMPVIGWLLATSGFSYIAVAIKVASMGQQVSADESRTAGRALVASTVLGGIGAVLIWLVLKVWPSLLLYTLLTTLAGLIFGRRIFAGVAFTPTGQIWSYGFVTMLIILGPVVLDSGDAAGSRFFDRIVMFLMAGGYSYLAVLFFDGFLGRSGASSGTLEQAPTGRDGNAA
jgi:hypothetical protein